jgi:hypothetical protein
MFVKEKNSYIVSEWLDTPLNRERLYLWGMEEYKGEVELGYDNVLYVKGHAPQKTIKQQKEERLTELKALLKSKDYIGVKIATGVATKEDYAEEIRQCELWREEIRKLEGEI